MSFCRFCAEVKPPDKLLDLYQHPQELNDIHSRLVILRLENIVDITCDSMAKCVCFKCMERLKSSSEFVRDLEKAQTLLREHCKIVKKESEDDCFDYPDLEVSFKNSDDIETSKEHEEKPDYEQLEKLKINISELLVERKKKKLKKKKVKNGIKVNIKIEKINWHSIKVKCAECNLTFINVKDLRTHIISSHDSCGIFKCIYCESEIHTLNNYLKHMRTHEPQLKLCCHICNTIFDTTSMLKLHLGRHDRSNDCPCCGETFDCIEKLNEHKNKFVSDAFSTEVIVCPLCEKVFKSKANLQVHLPIHNNARSRDYTCEVCGKAFYNKGTLTGHLLQHVDKRPHKCKICSLSFKRISQLRSHVLTHSGEKPFSCEQCGKGFRLKYQLKSHMIIHTDSMPHTCEYCGKAFRFKSLLTQHFRQHTGAKPYSCEICEKDFTNWANYNKHMKRRHKLDMSKKKRTPDGVYPVNPLTGEIQCSMEDAEEWKEAILKKSRRGRPKIMIHSEFDVAIVKQETETKI